MTIWHGIAWFDVLYLVYITMYKYHILRFVKTSLLNYSSILVQSAVLSERPMATKNLSSTRLKLKKGKVPNERLLKGNSTLVGYRLIQLERFQLKRCHRGLKCTDARITPRKRSILSLTSRPSIRNTPLVFVMISASNFLWPRQMYARKYHRLSASREHVFC